MEAALPNRREAEEAEAHNPNNPEAAAVICDDAEAAVEEVPPNRRDAIS